MLALLVVYPFQLLAITKTSPLICWLFSGAHIGPEPTTDRFIVVMVTTETAANIFTLLKNQIPRIYFITIIVVSLLIVDNQWVYAVWS